MRRGITGQGQHLERGSSEPEMGGVEGGVYTLIYVVALTNSSTSNLPIIEPALVEELLARSFSVTEPDETMVPRLVSYTPRWSWDHENAVLALA